MEICAVGKRKTKRLPQRQSWGRGGGVWPSYAPKSHTFCVADDPANGFLLPTLSSPPPQTRQKATFHYPVQSQYFHPPFTENVLLSCIITISPPTLHKNKRSTVLYNHTNSPPYPVKKATFYCPVQSH